MMPRPSLRSGVTTTEKTLVHYSVKSLKIYGLPASANFAMSAGYGSISGGIQALITPWQNSQIAPGAPEKHTLWTTCLVCKVKSDSMDQRCRQGRIIRADDPGNVPQSPATAISYWLRAWLRSDCSNAASSASIFISFCLRRTMSSR